MKVGDRIEFDRGTYSHFAVYMGEGYVEGEVRSSHVVAQNGYDERGLFRLEQIWGTSRCRVNNLLDEKHKPFDPPEIKKRALDMVEGRESWGAYNLATNNCEHFASWARNGVAHSKQVLDAGERNNL